jgi:hypothetical protein
MDSAEGCEVSVRTMSEILSTAQIKDIACLKADIEGYEDEALAPWFRTVCDALLPASVILERPTTRAGGLEKVLAERGYRPDGGTRANAFFLRGPAQELPSS